MGERGLYSLGRCEGQSPSSAWIRHKVCWNNDLMEVRHE